MSGAVPIAAGAPAQPFTTSTNTNSLVQLRSEPAIPRPPPPAATLPRP